MTVRPRYMFAGLAVTGAIFAIAGCGSTQAIAPTVRASASTSSTAPASSSKPAATKTPSQSAGDAVKALLAKVDARQWGPEWDSVYPAQQSLVPRALYISCSAASAPPGVKDVSVTATYDETIDIPGTSLHVPSTAVSVSMTLYHGTTTQPDKETLHMVNVDGMWKWIISDPQGYAGGKCPAG